MISATLAHLPGLQAIEARVKRTHYDFQLQTSCAPDMVTLLILVVVVLLVSAGQLSMFDIDLSAFPGGTVGVIALVVIALLVTRRI